jgi:hypothetical protein
MTWLEIHNYGSVGIQNNAPGSIENVGSILQVNRAVITSGLSEIRAILNELPPDQREEVQSYLETIEDELKAATPREGRIKNAFTAIRRAVAAVAKPVE